MKLAVLLLTMDILASTRAFILPGTPEQTNIANVHQTNELAEVGENQIAKELEHLLGKPLTTMSFAGTTGLNIYRVQGRKNYHSKSLYQFSPAAILDSSSITQWYSGVNNQLYFGFRLQMWNETIQQAVATHLTRVTGKKVRTYQVESIPFDRVILTRSSDVEEDGRYHMAQPMIPYTQTVGFSLACYDKAECQQLAEQFRNEPEQFDKFKVAYSMDSRRQTETKIVQVTQSMLTQTNQLFSQISQRFPRTNEILLSVGDAQRLLWRAVSDIVRKSFGEQPEAIVRRDSRQKIYDQLEKVVVAAKVTISTADDAKWPTVYWEDPLSRPDAIARSLNERKRHLVHHDDDLRRPGGTAAAAVVRRLEDPVEGGHRRLVRPAQGIGQLQRREICAQTDPAVQDQVERHPRGSRLEGSRPARSELSRGSRNDWTHRPRLLDFLFLGSRFTCVSGIGRGNSESLRGEEERHLPADRRPDFDRPDQKRPHWRVPLPWTGRVLPGRQTTPSLYVAQQGRAAGIVGRMATDRTVEGRRLPGSFHQFALPARVPVPVGRRVLLRQGSTSRLHLAPVQQTRGRPHLGRRGGRLAPGHLPRQHGAIPQPLRPFQSQATRVPLRGSRPVGPGRDPPPRLHLARSRERSLGRTQEPMGH
ncbi:hypothetical protein DAPPUDRAFT_307231 [Daphnia pulex]|uniref:Uncharacterized protein n=1 Tax=Daphnia pulex TaxID=6669 RepID=E9H132_DAPPU|nr:hypothetical protein DAPPUDRAFT_307231 [Daphnia pulex]|eukprot:EFX74558.1 hypothetical protein DAPPUDRAFT_307231 [Daphnia pulex]